MNEQEPTTRPTDHNPGASRCDVAADGKPLASSAVKPSGPMIYVIQKGANVIPFLPSKGRLAAKG